MTWIARVVAGSVLAFWLSGCAKSEQCEAARLDLSRTWGDLRQSAIRRKLAGVDVEGWAAVEDRTALLESSFMTTQVTWGSAEKARTQLSARLAQLSTDTDAKLQTYRASVEAAFKQQDEYQNACR